MNLSDFFGAVYYNMYQPASKGALSRFKVQPAAIGAHTF
jgi:hypothetical protein